jgi:ABC-2 type transport system ATP-binding protein
MVQLDQLNFAYKKAPVFDDVQLSFQSGSLYGILGKNGSGKSTLLYLIAGLLRPASGTINMMGFTPHERKPAFLENVFMIPEEFHIPDISISAFIRYYGVFYPRFDREAFEANLDAFEIPQHTLLKMSYGQKKKVLISFGLATGVSLLLMDEPTNGLDIISKGQFRKVIARSLTADNTILISSHQVSDLASLVDHIVVLEGARIAVQNSISEIEKKLLFKVSADPAEMEGVLYQEMSRGGNALVAINDGSEESLIDLELFYKAAMYNPAGVAYALKN